MVLVGLASTAIGQTPGSKQYSTDLAQWRKAQEHDLTRDEGWLSVAGLFWLKEGDCTIGSSEACAVRLPESAPAEVGTLTREGNHVTLTTKVGVVATLKGQKVISQELALDSDRVSIGSLTFMAIHRGSRIGVRLFDKSCKGYKEFKGQNWYAANPKFVLQAKFVPYEPPKSVNITNVIGDTQPVAVVGYVEFTLDGKVCRLDAQGQGGGLFINFRDNTSGKTTYPAGRFLDAPAPVNGMVTIDFNRATNPPCAWTSFATCPLPPRQNFLGVAVPAGEKTHHPVE